MAEKKRKKPEKPRNIYLPPKSVKQVRDQYGRLVWVENRVNPDRLPAKKWDFSQITGDHICMLVTEGYTLKEVSGVNGMPPLHVIYKWKRDNEEFREQLGKAFEDRAHFYHDHAVETALTTNNKNQVPVNRLKIDTLKWAAEKGNTASYGNKQVVEGNPDKPVQFVIDTGVQREVIEVESEVSNNVIETSGEEVDGKRSED